MNNGIHNPWIKLLLCYFLGVFGVHKFIEKKTGMGVLYLCTVGLFGIGWIIDVVKYLVAAIKSISGNRITETNLNNNFSPSRDINPASDIPHEAPKNLNVKKILLWILAGFFALATLVYLTSGGIIAALFGALFVALIIPIDSWQSMIKTFIKGKLKPIIAVILAVLCFATVPTPDAPTVNPDDLAALVGNMQNNPTGDPSLNPSAPFSDVTTNPSTAVTTEPTTALTTEPTTAPTTEPMTAPTTEVTTPSTSVNSSFSIHFIDVGQADAALVECDGHYMLIDGGNKADSSLIYSVLKKAEVSKLDIVVGTHAHEDHIGGLPGAFNYTTADLTLCPVKSYDSNAFEDFSKYANQKGGGITIPSVGNTYGLGSATVSILGVNGGSDPNDTSIILRIDYGETSFLFTGDAEREAEQAVLNSGLNLSATVLKVGHHGSDTSTGYVFLREVMPQYAIISVGNDNSYGHPTENTLSRLRDADVKLFRTDLQGDVYCTSDGKTVTFSVEKNADADVFGGIGGNSTQTNPTETNPPATQPSQTEPPETNPPETQPPQTESPATEPEQQANMVWIPNSGSKYHTHSGCSNMKNPSQVTEEQAKAMGYTPCKRCH